MAKTVLDTCAVRACHNMTMGMRKVRSQVRFSFLALDMLNKIRCRAHFLFSANQIAWHGWYKLTKWMVNKADPDQLICTYTVCKGNYSVSGSAGSGLSWTVSLFLLFFFFFVFCCCFFFFFFVSFFFFFFFLFVFSFRGRHLLHTANSLLVVSTFQTLGLF